MQTLIFTIKKKMQVISFSGSHDGTVRTPERIKNSIDLCNLTRSNIEG